MTRAHAPTEPLAPDALAPELKWLVSLARRLARTGEDADDLAQDTWLVAMQQPDTTKGSSRPWLAGVLRNLRRMRARTEHRRVAREATLVPEPEVGPEAALEQLETLDVLHEALGLLDPVDRKLVLGRYASGHDAVQLGQQFDLPPSTVRTRLSRATHRLRDHVVARRGAACFVPWAIAQPLADAGAGLGRAGTVVAMSATTKIGLGVAAAALVAVAIVQISPAPAATKAPPTSATVDTTPAPRDADREHVVHAREMDRQAAHAQKLGQIQARRRARLEALALPERDDAEPAIVTDQCDDGCMGTLGMQIALAHAISGCRDDLPEGAKGRTKFRVHVIAEPDAGAVADAIEVVHDDLGQPDFTECVIQSAPLAELRDPEQPVSDTFTFRFNVGVRSNPATEFAAANPDLIAAHPEFAYLATQSPDTLPTDETATAFARWIDGDAEAQVAFGKWAAAEGIDLAMVRVDD